MDKTKLLNNMNNIKEKVVDTSIKVAKKSKEVYQITSKKVKDKVNEYKEKQIEKKENEIISINNEIDNEKNKLAGTIAATLLALLGESPTIINYKNINKAKSKFPIPNNHVILWLDAEFDLRPSGIVLTNKGVFIKTDVDPISLTKEDKEKNKSKLFYYKWENFEPSWFVSNKKEENFALLVNEKCSNHFINACKIYNSNNKKNNLKDISTYNYEKEINDYVAKVAPLQVAGMQSSLIAEDVNKHAHYKTPGGHGLMAEKANDLFDKLSFKNAKIVGGDNAKDGPDRLVNGTFIQTKYYNTAFGSVDTCFNPNNGTYRYMKDGKPMLLEVPKDQYEKAIIRFKQKIENGQVPGVTDPNEAYNIVKKGKITYNQAVNLTKPGTIESLTYDIATGAVICSCAFGISFLVTAFISYRKNKNIDEAIKDGTAAGLQVFGVSFIQHILVSQIARTSLSNCLMAPSQAIVNSLGTNASATIVNGIRALSGQSAIYGAAATKSLAKIMRSNFLTSSITFVVFSVPETYKLATKKISTSQYTKNITSLLGSMTGGAVGALAAGVAVSKIAGAAGTTVAPGVGTAVGIVGGFAGGVIGATVVNKVNDILIEDDIVVITRLFNAMITSMISDYLLDENESNLLLNEISKIDSKELKELFIKIKNSSVQEDTINEILVPYFDNVVKSREKFNIPNELIII